MQLTTTRSPLSRNRVSIIAAFALAAATSVFAAREGAQSEKKARLEDLTWLAGHWRSDSGGRIVEEVWLPSRGGSMIGMNRTTVGDGGSFEFLRIERKDGKIAYLASPGGQFPPTVFLMKSLDGRVVEFENPDHDFPKRIRYERKGDNLTASIHGDGNESMSWTWKLATKLD